MPRDRGPVPVDAPPESENYVDYAHQLRVVVIPDTSGPLVTVRVYCVRCGFRFQVEEAMRTCEPIEPRAGKAPPP